MSDSVDTLKQRVVGAFVIISLAVIFLPMIFDEPHQQQSNIIVPVPPRPSFKVIEIDKPIKPEFQRLELDTDTDKIAKKESSVESVQNTSQSSSVVVENTNTKRDGAHTISLEQSDQTKKAAPTKSTSPSVNHLPIFKNVWMVQLGTFSQSDNAYQLRDQLRKDGFDGHTKKVDLNGNEAIRVFTGPFVDKKEAEKIKVKLDKKYKVDSRVIFFDA